MEIILLVVRAKLLAKFGAAKAIGDHIKARTSLMLLVHSVFHKISDGFLRLSRIALRHAVMGRIEVVIIDPAVIHAFIDGRCGCNRFLCGSVPPIRLACCGQGKRMRQQQCTCEHAYER